MGKVAPAGLDIVGEAGDADPADAVAGTYNCPPAWIQQAGIDRADVGNQDNDLEDGRENYGLVGSDGNFSAVVGPDFTCV